MWLQEFYHLAGIELAHFAFSFCAVLLAVSPAAFWIWTTYHPYSGGTRTSPLSSGARTAYMRLVFYMVLLSLSVGLVAHVLEDIFIRAF